MRQRVCAKCGFEYEHEGFANFITFCPSCNNYDHMECEYGFGPVVPCRIYHGSKIIGLVSYDENYKPNNYRLDSDTFDIHKILEKRYLEALNESIDILSELIK